MLTYIRDQVKENKIATHYVSTEDNLTLTFTPPTEEAPHFVLLRRLT